MIDEPVGSAESHAKTLRLKQAHAMLNLFETDLGRVPVTLVQVKEWAAAQEDEQLRSRVDRFVRAPAQGL